METSRAPRATVRKSRGCRGMTYSRCRTRLLNTLSKSELPVTGGTRRTVMNNAGCVVGFTLMVAAVLHQVHSQAHPLNHT